MEVFFFGLVDLWGSSFELVHIFMFELEMFLGSSSGLQIFRTGSHGIFTGWGQRKTRKRDVF